jgi:hypothetical protein
MAVRLSRPAILGLPQYSAETGKLLDIGSLLDPFCNPVPNLEHSRDQVGMVMGSCLWIPKTLWDELGGFPEWFESIGEDLYLCCQARVAGHSVRVAGESGYRHHVGNSFGGGKLEAGGRLVTTLRRRALSERNKTFVMALTYPASLLWLIFPVHLVSLAIEGLLLASVKRRWSLLKCVYGACLTAVWQERHRLTQLRWRIQKQRKIGAAEFAEVFLITPYKLRMLFRYGWPTFR